MAMPMPCQLLASNQSHDNLNSGEISHEYSSKNNPQQRNFPNHMSIFDGFPTILDAWAISLISDIVKPTQSFSHHREYLLHFKNLYLRGVIISREILSQINLTKGPLDLHCAHSVIFSLRGHNFPPCTYHALIIIGQLLFSNYA